MATTVRAAVPYYLAYRLATREPATDEPVATTELNKSRAGGALKPIKDADGRL